MIHVYYGDGKGKTTAAMGLALRALGSGLPVAIVQFLKNTPTGEIEALRALPGVSLFRGSGGGFARDMTPAQLEDTRRIHLENFHSGLEAAQGGGLLVLDELLTAIRLELFPLGDLLALLDAPPKGLELALTGHSLPDAVRRRADYITHMVKEKHPYDRGVQARRGVEY